MEYLVSDILQMYANSRYNVMLTNFNWKGPYYRPRSLADSLYWGLHSVVSNEDSFNQFAI